MSPAILIIALIGVAAYAFAALALGYYTSVSLRRGSAQGLGWHFDRATHAAPFRFQVAGALVCCIYSAMQAIGTVYTLMRV